MSRLCAWWLLMVVVMACSAATAAESIRIGVSLGLTGDYALTSNKQKNGYELFEQEINSTGGVLGRRVELLIRDNGSIAEQAICPV